MELLLGCTAGSRRRGPQRPVLRPGSQPAARHPQPSAHVKVLLPSRLYKAVHMYAPTLQSPLVKYHRSPDVQGPELGPERGQERGSRGGRSGGLETEELPYTHEAARVVIYRHRGLGSSFGAEKHWGGCCGLSHRPVFSRSSFFLLPFLLLLRVPFWPTSLARGKCPPPRLRLREAGGGCRWRR